MKRSGVDVCWQTYELPKGTWVSETAEVTPHLLTKTMEDQAPHSLGWSHCTNYHSFGGPSAIPQPPLFPYRRLQERRTHSESNASTASQLSLEFPLFEGNKEHPADERWDTAQLTEAFVHWAAVVVGVLCPRPAPRALGSRLRPGEQPSGHSSLDPEVGVSQPDFLSAGSELRNTGVGSQGPRG